MKKSQPHPPVNKDDNSFSGPDESDTNELEPLILNRDETVSPMCRLMRLEHLLQQVGTRSRVVRS